MASLRIRFQFELSTWLVFKSVPLFDITVSPHHGTTVIIPPPPPLDAPASPYSIFLDLRHHHDSNSILLDVIMDKGPTISSPSSDSSLQEAMWDKEHEHNRYIRHAQAVAMEYAERLIELIRWRTNQSWVGVGGHRTGHDYRLAWVSASGRGKLIGKDRPLVRGDTPVGIVKPGEDFQLVDEQMWRQVAQDLYDGTEPALHDKLLLDAHYFLHVGNRRRCTLEAAIACELFVRRRIVKLTPDSDDPVLRELVRPGSFVERYLHLAPLHLKSRSLKSENTDLWRRAKELFKARNDVAHAEEVEDAEHDVGKDIGKSHLETAREVVDWVASL